MSKGIFIVVDGSDGTGKHTQHKRLLERLESENIPFSSVDFPQYGNPSAYFVEQYLGGSYGNVNDVPAKQASLFYAMDRFASKSQIRDSIEQGKIVVANRFTASNMGHQGAKITDDTERVGLFEWIDNLEHEILGIPRPDLNIILTVPHSLAQRNINERAARKNRKPDVHEADPNFLVRSLRVYDELCEIFPQHFVRIDCAKNENEMVPLEEIHDLVWQQVKNRMQTENKAVKP